MKDSSPQAHVGIGRPRAAAEMPRRHFLGLLGGGGLAAALAEGAVPAVTWGGADLHEGQGGGMDPDEALKRLMAGNRAYVAGKAKRPNQTAKRRVEVSKGQHPFAIILGCADSRVPPELVFDQGLGDLFVIRVAGNIADDADLGSIEYAVGHLGSRLIVVLGHEKCGAVAAALEVAEKGITLPGHLPAVVKPILPAVEAVKGKGGERLDAAVRANVMLVVSRLKSSEPVIGAMAGAGKIKIVGGRYDLKSGAVELIV